MHIAGEVCHRRSERRGTEEYHMATQEHVYGEVDNVTDLRDIFQQIRKDVDEASTRDRLTELYRRAGYLVTLTRSPSWETKFGKGIDELRRVAEHEFAQTARTINQRARQIGAEPDYDETWGE
jgi:hypothetical protein